MSNARSIILGQEFARPAKDCLAALEEVSTSVPADCHPCVGVIGHPLVSFGKIHGFLSPALTVGAGSLAQWKALDLARPGDVLVIASNIRRNCAEFGGVYVAIARRKRLSAIVTDGLVRDLDEICDIPFPVIGRGTHASSPSDPTPGTINLPVLVRGVLIMSGDILVGDRDGIAVLPSTQIREIVSRIKKKQQQEAFLHEAVSQGIGLPPSVAATLAGIEIQTKNAPDRAIAGTPSGRPSGA